MKMRRYLLKLLRLRSILYFTIIIILFFVVKSLRDRERPYHSELHEYSASNFLPLESDDGIMSSKDLGHFVPTKFKKIDWHNHKQIEIDKKMIGLGEQGKPAHLPKELSALEEKLYSENGFNGALSDKISLNRSLPDIRHPKCINLTYIESLPTVSVVVPFHNEHWSTLLRTAYSVLKRSPSKLIKEIFLVDDASTKDFLKQKLDDYVKEHLPKVRIVRVQKRSGLITARLAGAREATGDVLLFLDSHTEANENWLPPLLEPIALNYKTVVCPFIDVVAYDTFEYRAQDEGARGAFDWELFYKRLPVLPSDQANMPAPFRSPVMAGGLFAISRKFFWELGGYDPGLDIWGGEQYELSFKIWQCGGEMLDAPCSRVGHIYRKFAPFPNPGHGDFVGKNYRRVAEVWMDEYAQHLYARRPHYLKIDPGDITAQRALRARLRCKPFKWFMHKIAFDLTAKYPPVEPSAFAEGQIRPEGNKLLCLDMHSGKQMDSLQLAACSSSGEQRLVLSWHKDVKSSKRNMCWDAPDAAPGSRVLLYGCHLGGGNQLWRYHPETLELRQGDGDNCLDYDKATSDVYLQPCDKSDTQRWTIDNVNQEMMERWSQVFQRVTGPVDY